MRNGDYDWSARLLHRIALGVPAIAQTFFDFETALRKAPKDTSARHVFVSGLARSGTTVLLRALYETGRFRSLTYRDMPFVLMPGLWNAFSRYFRRDQDAAERAHGDRIMVDFDSPEAFEEVFWRVFCGEQYIKPDRLEAHRADRETIEQFRQYVAQIIASADTSDRPRYLSKNNNNLLRLPSIREAFPAAIILIPFRNPVQQAHSLLKQHRLFSVRHREDRFSRDYMRWLGHHEFGLSHKPFAFGSAWTSGRDTDDINYWLDMWTDTYRYAKSNLAEGSVLVCYEALCAHQEETFGQILGHIGIDMDSCVIDTVFDASFGPEPEGIDTALRTAAMRLYEELVDGAAEALLS